MFVTSAPGLFSFSVELYLKIVDFSGIRTRIVAVQGENAFHLTTTTDGPEPVCLKIRLGVCLSVCVYTGPSLLLSFIFVVYKPFGYLLNQ